MKSTTPTEPTEETPWIPNDPTPGWVCAVGGYEALVHGNADHGTRWLLKFGMKRHPAYNGSGLSGDCLRFRGATHYGYHWWGNPRDWPTRWSTAWEEMLIREEALRELTGFHRLYAGLYETPRVALRRRR